MAFTLSCEIREIWHKVLDSPSQNNQNAVYLAEKQCCGESSTLTLAEATEVLKADVIVPARDVGAELTGCIAADLMSDVLAFSRQGSLLITGLTTHQTIRTAAITHMAAVVIVEGKSADGDMVEAAREEDIPILLTPLSKYEACGLLVQAGLRPYRKGAGNKT